MQRSAHHLQGMFSNLMVSGLSPAFISFISLFSRKNESQSALTNQSFSEKFSSSQFYNFLPGRKRHLGLSSSHFQGLLQQGKLRVKTPQREAGNHRNFRETTLINEEEKWPSLTWKPDNFTVFISSLARTCSMLL